MKECIEFKNFGVTLKGKELFRGLSFKISRGGKYMLSGENGSGKSLLLELIAIGASRDLAERYEGIEITGEILDSQGRSLLDPRTERKIAYVAQTESIYKNATLYEQARIACHGIGIEPDEDKLDYLLERFGMSEKKHRKLKNDLSMGQGKIVHLITRILKLPAADIMLLDEPLNHLSFGNSRVFNELMMEEIRKKPDLTVVTVSHCRALSYADRGLEYNSAENRMDETLYSSYDCFERK